MFVPSLSWQNVRFLYINGSKMPFSAGLAPNPFIATVVYGFLDATTGTYCTIYLHCTVLCIGPRTSQLRCMHLTRNDKLLLCMRACCYNTLCLLIVSSLHTALRVCLSVCLSGCLCVCVIRAGLHGSGGWANYMEVGGEDTAMLNATWNTIACKQRLDLTWIVLTRQLRRGNELS